MRRFEPTIAEKIETAKIHLVRLTDLKREMILDLVISSTRNLYLKGAPRAAKVKLAINQANTSAEIVAIFDDYLKNL